jgi:hypothetical protein
MNIITAFNNKYRYFLVALAGLALAFCLISQPVFAEWINGAATVETIGLANKLNSYLTIGPAGSLSSDVSISMGTDNPKAHELTQFPLLVTLLEVGPALIFLLFFGAVMFFLVRLIKVKSTLNIWGMVISTLGLLVMLAMMPSIVNSFYNILSGNF